MKYVILALGLAILSSAARAESVLSVPGLATMIADAAKNSKAVGLIDLNGDTAAGAFVPIRTLHDGTGIDYLELGIGGASKQDEHLKPLGIIDFNLSAIWRRTEKSVKWWDEHTSKLPLPDVWIGPSIRLPMPGDVFTWGTWRNWVGASASVKL